VPNLIGLMVVKTEEEPAMNLQTSGESRAFQCT
jgi:hypothetical protein